MDYDLHVGFTEFPFSPGEKAKQFLTVQIHFVSCVSIKAICIAYFNKMAVQNVLHCESVKLMDKVKTVKCHC